MIIVKKHKRKGKVIRSYKRKKRKQAIVGINYPAMENNNATGTVIS